MKNNPSQSKKKKQRTLEYIPTKEEAREIKKQIIRKAVRESNKAQRELVKEIKCECEWFEHPYTKSCPIHCLPKEPTQDWEEEFDKIKHELLDMVNEYFPKIKPQGINKGRGEAAVIVGTALARFSDLLQKERERVAEKSYEKGFEAASKEKRRIQKMYLDLQKLKEGKNDT